MLAKSFCNTTLQRWSRSQVLMPQHRRNGRYHFFTTVSPSLAPLAKNNWSEREQSLFAQGFLDERGLTVFETLHEMQVRSCEVFESEKLFGTYNDELQKFHWKSYADFGCEVEKCRSVLKDLGVQEYDKVGIISSNRWEWATIAAAAYSINANIVPMYEAQLSADWTYILNDSNAKLLFCATQDIYNRVTHQVVPNAPNVREVFCLDAPMGEPHAFATAMSSVIADSSGKLIQPPIADDLANLIYTSGTTGKPKGVELTHGNFCSNIKSAVRSMVRDPQEYIRPGDASLAFLPWAHSYGQTCELWASISHGAAVGICRGVPKILEDLQLVKPNFLFAVPTLYKKIYDGVHNMMQTASPLRRNLILNALDIGHQKSSAEAGERLPLSFFEKTKFSLLDSLVLSKIRDRFGGNMRHGFVAGAACSVEVLRFMHSIGIPIYEGYGLTETSPVITVNSPEQFQLGSVGRAISGVTVYIVDEERKEVPAGVEGEICCVGPNVMRGYYKNPDATNEVISTAPDGKSRMFHTGDLGRMGMNGFLKVTGRLKEQYKLENGKYVVPTPIELAISMSRLISQVVLCGANRPYNVALIVPEWTAISSALSILENVPEDKLANDKRVVALLDAEIKSACVNLKKFEIPQKWAIVAPFTTANDMMTPKMSIRRHKVIQTYGVIVSSMYGNDPVAISADSTGAKERHNDNTQLVA